MALNIKNHHLYNIWDQVPVTYYQLGVKKNILQKIWHGRKVEQALEILRSIQFKNCLDVGCASGYMLSEVKKAFPGKKYFGVDIYDKAIKFAKRQYPRINFKVAPGDELPFSKASFDLVLCYETIEHVEDPFSVLREIKRVLKRDGTCLLAMDSGSWLFRAVWFFWEKTTGKVWAGAHLHPFRHRELDDIVKKSRFEIKKKIFSHWGMEVVFVLKR